MSYYNTGNTELVSRQGYSGMGATNPFMPTDAELARAAAQMAADKAKKSGGTWLGAITGALNAYGANQQAEAAKAQAAAAAAAAAGRPVAKPMPSWLLPVGLGAGALVLLLVLKKK